MSERLPFDPKPLRVLVVDTHDLIRKSIARVLFKMEFGEIFECHNGKDAKVILNTETVDLVICDLDLGQITGFELLDLIRNSETGSDIPFIIVTGDADKDDIVKAADKGADDYMLKPFQPEDLEKKVLKVMSTFLSPGPLLAKIRDTEKLLKSKQWEEAIATIDNVIVQKPDSARATHLKAVVHAKAGQTEQAIELLKLNIKNQPNYLKNYASIADLYFFQRDYKKAIAAMMQELELNPKQIHRQIKLANLLLREGNTKSAVDHYRFALLENNKNSEALFGMGTAYAIANNLEKSIYYFKRMRRHHPKQIKPLQAIKKYCMAQDNPRLAEMCLRDEKKSHPERTDTYVLLAEFYFELEREEEAIATLLEALQRNPNFTDGYMKLALYFAGKEKFDEVSALFDRYYHTTKDPNVYIREADIFLRAGRYALSIAALHKGMKPNANLVMLFRLLLICSLKTKQHGKAYFVLHKMKTISKEDTSQQYLKEIKSHLQIRRNKLKAAQKTSPRKVS
ncbi:MAG: response regulator [Oligoflexus sp.]